MGSFHSPRSPRTTTAARVQESAMLTLDSHPSGRHFLQIPGPTNVPDRVLHAIAFPTIDHRGPEFGEIGKEIVAADAVPFNRSFPAER